jgi:hypothetical protein
MFRGQRIRPLEKITLTIVKEPEERAANAPMAWSEYQKASADFTQSCRKST